MGSCLFNLLCCSLCQGSQPHTSGCLSQHKATTSFNVETQTTIQGVKGRRVELFTHKFPFTLCADSKDDQCGTAEEGNGWELVCQRQTSSGVDEGHPALKLHISHSTEQNICPPISFPPCISHQSLFLSHLPHSPKLPHPPHPVSLSFVILLNAVSHPAAQETKGVKWLNPCFLLEICECDALTTNNNHNNNKT